MNWITIVWLMNAGACLALAAIYFVLWCSQRKSWMYLAFSCSAVAGAALTAFELALLRAQTTEQYGVIVRWAQLPIWVLVDAGGFRAALSACRATMARMDCLLCADMGVDFEFSFYTEPQLSRNHEPEAALVVGRPDGVRSSWRDKSVDFSRSTQFAVAYCFFH